MSLTLNNSLGIEIDATNQILWSSLRACQEAYESDKKTRFAAAAVDREKEADRIKKIGAAKALALSDKVEKEKEKIKMAAEAELSGFFSDLADSGRSDRIYLHLKSDLMLHLHNLYLSFGTFILVLSFIWSLLFFRPSYHTFCLNPPHSYVLDFWY